MKINLHNPPNEVINKLIYLYNQKNMLAVIKQAKLNVEKYPNAFLIWNILGAALADTLGMLDKSIEAYKKCISLKPDFAEAYNNMGIALQKLKRYDEAINVYQKAISIKPEHEHFYNNMGSVFKDKGEFEKAIETYKKCISINPRNVDALYNLGNTLKDNHQYDEAIKEYEKCISTNPNYIKAYLSIGDIYKDQGKLKKAIEIYKKVLLIKPNDVRLYNNIGIIFKELGKLNKAIKIFNEALLLKPNDEIIYNNLGNTFHDQNNLDEAISAFKKSITLNPNYASPYINLGNVYKDQGKYKESIKSFHKALSLNPNDYNIYNNMGNTYRDKGQLKKAIELYNRSLSINPNNAETHNNLSISLLTVGKVKEGLNENEWRWKTAKLLKHKRKFLQPLWDGKVSLKDKRILVWCEQGIGDTLNWSSHLPLIISKAKCCILECQEKLVPLLKRSFPNIQIKAENRSSDLQRNDFDIHLPMGSIYKHFIDEILKKPKINPYLVPNEVRVNFWKKRLNSLGNGPFVGVSWKSSVTSNYRLQHYPPITDWGCIFKIPNITFINLQYTDYKNDLIKIDNEFKVKVHNFDDLDQYNNIDDLAALSSALDMVVSTKVTPPIISSGVGTITKIANWRQSTFNNVLTNPVSATLEMFNKDTDETWDGVFNLIAKQVFKLKKSY